MNPVSKDYGTLLDLLVTKGVVIHAACGGQGRCGQCRIKLKGRINAPTRFDRTLIPSHLIMQGYRLACQYKVKNKELSDFDVESVRVDPARHSKGTGRRQDRPCGLALDLGTTVIKGARVNLESGEVTDTVKTYNPQNSCGADVMTRISAALSGRYDFLRRQLLDGVSAVRKQLGFAVVSVRTAAAGNPVMSSFYLGKPVVGLARYPYAGAITKSIRQNKHKRFVFGSVGGFVGGDTIAGILASGLHRKPGVSLYIDLGTNGEIALLTSRRIYALSTAAGPALEGAGLKCGSLAIPGAIDAIEGINRQSGFKIHTIGDERPRGICASGLVDLLAILLKRGWLTRFGRLIRPVRVSGICIGQHDIRQLQLAIGAIHTGVQFLMEHAGAKAGDITTTIITGEFGSHLNTASLKQVGIIPEDLTGVRLERDLVLKGSVKALRDAGVYKEAETIRRRSRHIELAMQPDFQKRFVSALQLAPWTA
jgi:uncharacterized 2Fe-2S/4Fe-4S cluster protein (DUF4445 family)